MNETLWDAFKGSMEVSDVITRLLSSITNSHGGQRRSPEARKNQVSYPSLKGRNKGTTGWSASPQFLGR